MTLNPRKAPRNTGHQDEEHIVMNERQRPSRVDDELMDHLAREMKRRIQERVSRGEARDKAQGTENGRAALLIRAEHVLPERLDELRQIEDLDERRGTIETAIVDLAKNTKQQRHGDAWPRT